MSVLLIREPVPRSSLLAGLTASLVDFTWNVEPEKIFLIYPDLFITMSR